MRDEIGERVAIKMDSGISYDVALKQALQENNEQKRRRLAWIKEKRTGG